jgi:hypothetical protein
LSLVFPVTHSWHNNAKWQKRKLNKLKTRSIGSKAKLSMCDVNLAR